MIRAEGHWCWLIAGAVVACSSVNLPETSDDIAGKIGGMPGQGGNATVSSGSAGRSSPSASVGGAGMQRGTAVGGASAAGGAGRSTTAGAGGSSAADGNEAGGGGSGTGGRSLVGESGGAAGGSVRASAGGAAGRGVGGGAGRGAGGSAGRGAGGAAGRGTGGAAGPGTGGNASSGVGGAAAPGSGGGAGRAVGGGTSGSCDTPPPSSELVGWAAVSGNGVTTTTGGGSATPVTVSSLADLQAAVKGTTAAVVYVKGVLSPGTLTIGSNKTIVGLCGAEIHGHLGLSGSSNVIIRNIKIVGYAVGDCSLDPSYSSSEGCSSGSDAISIQGQSHHLWFDHDDVSDGTDGNLDLTHATDYVTISGPSSTIRLVRTIPAATRRAPPGIASAIWSATTTTMPARTRGTCGSPGTTIGGPTTCPNDNPVFGSGRITSSTTSGRQPATAIASVSA